MLVISHHPILLIIDINSSNFTYKSFSLFVNCKHILLYNHNPFHSFLTIILFHKLTFTIVYSLFNLFCFNHYCLVILPTHFQELDNPGLRFLVVYDLSTGQLLRCFKTAASVTCLKISSSLMAVIMFLDDGSMVSCDLVSGSCKYV